MNRRLLILTLGCVFLVGIFHQLGSIFYFYWQSVSFDFFMHALGALTISLLFLWLWFVSGLFGKSTPSKREAMVNAIVVVILVGLGWELFEYAYDIATPIGGNYALDTFRDLLADFIGAVVGGFIGRLKVWYE